MASSGSNSSFGSLQPNTLTRPIPLGRRNPFPPSAAFYMDPFQEGAGKGDAKGGAKGAKGAAKGGAKGAKGAKGDANSVKGVKGAHRRPFEAEWNDQSIWTLYFYGEGNFWGIFSNFFYIVFQYDGHRMYWSEQAFMWEKYKLFDPQNEVLRDAILNARNPGQVKELGRSVPNYVDEVWANARPRAMFNVLKEKFGQDEELKALLLRTGDRVLAEAAQKDRVWGIGLSVEQAQAGVPWRGDNLLGYTLMDVRNFFRAQMP